jgi:hypothetical protein
MTDPNPVALDPRGNTVAASPATDTNVSNVATGDDVAVSLAPEAEIVLKDTKKTVAEPPKVDVQAEVVEAVDAGHVDAVSPVMTPKVPVD